MSKTKNSDRIVTETMFKGLRKHGGTLAMSSASGLKVTVSNLVKD